MTGKKRIIVIKIGSSVLLTGRNKLDEFRIAHIADQIITLQNAGYNIVFVVSGAVACGVNLMTNASDRLHLSSDRLMRQAASGIGQVYLISTLLRIFEQKKLQIAQILLRSEDLKSASVRNNLKESLAFYMQSKIIPVFNENDVLELNSFGGNDFLAAEITMLLKADQLFILSTQEGSTFGVGGGKSKLEAVSLLTSRNIKASIVNGKAKNILLKTLL